MYYYIKSVLLLVFIIETRVCVGIWSCDKLSHKSPFEASQAIKTHYNRFIRMLQEKIVTTDSKIHVNEDEILKDDDQNISTANAVSLFNTSFAAVLEHRPLNNYL